MGEEDHQAIDLRIRKRLDDLGIYVAEDGGIGADAEGESDDGDGGESGSFAQGAEPVANVLDESFDEVDAAGFAARDAGVDEFGDVLVEVEAEFVVKFGFDLGAAKDGAQADQQVAQHRALLRWFPGPE